MSNLTELEEIRIVAWQHQQVPTQFLLDTVYKSYTLNNVYKPVVYLEDIGPFLNKTRAWAHRVEEENLDLKIRMKQNDTRMSEAYLYSSELEQDLKGTIPITYAVVAAIVSGFVGFLVAAMFTTSG